MSRKTWSQEDVLCLWMGIIFLFYVSCCTVMLQ
jgi:hypothetical protein